MSPRARKPKDAEPDAEPKVVVEAAGGDAGEAAAGDVAEAAAGAGAEASAGVAPEAAGADAPQAAGAETPKAGRKTAAKPRRRRRRAASSEPVEAVAEQGSSATVDETDEASDAAAPAAAGDSGEASGEAPASDDDSDSDSDSGSGGAPAPRPARTRRRDAAGPVTVRAQARYVRTSARKARLVCDHLRGQSVERARAILATAPRAVAEDWSKLLESAVASAEHDHELVGDELAVAAVYADEGPTLKRFRPRAMGRATRIRKRTSHLSITLTSKDH